MVKIDTVTPISSSWQVLGSLPSFEAECLFTASNNVFWVMMAVALVVVVAGALMTDLEVSNPVTVTWLR